MKRDGKTIADFDLYALLIHGDKSSDVRLLPEDVLYIPPAGSQVAITGSIRNPGIYEPVSYTHLDVYKRQVISYRI